MLEKTTPKIMVNLQYQLIKLAWSQFQRSPESLEPAELKVLQQQASVAQKIMSEVLGSQEASKEQVQEKEVHFLFEQLQEQFDNIDSFHLSLKEQGLTEQGLKDAIFHDLVCEKTLASQSQNYPAVTEQEALAYYDKNKARFLQPERRKVSHILITINDEYIENERKKSLDKIESLRLHLQDHIDEFAHFALQHSECPTSLNKGFIGDVSRGQLYPELELVLFNMKENRVSSVIETEIGFHILLCHEISIAGEMDKKNALKEIEKQLNSHRQKKSEKKWLSSLLATASESNKVSVH